MEELRLVVKWSGKEYSLNMAASDTVITLKEAIQKATGVRPDRQKLLNLKCKDETSKLSTIPCCSKANFKIMMMGSLEADIASASCGPPADAPEVINDLDTEEEEVAIENTEVYLSKVEKRIREYDIKIINEPREGKKLLVLDIDYTLFDHRSVAETGYELMRPYLHEFLTSAYEQYDIVIWSATNMKWIEEKMKLLGVSSHSDYKIMCNMDSLAMISVHTQKLGVVDVKPLGVIWGKFEQYSAKNTIMFDDIRRNFLMNPQSGLRIRPFRSAHLNRDKDQELLHLARYLRDIAELDDFTNLNHRHWERFQLTKKQKLYKQRKEYAKR